MIGVWNKNDKNLPFNPTGKQVDTSAGTWTALLLQIALLTGSAAIFIAQTYSKQLGCSGMYSSRRRHGVCKGCKFKQHTVCSPMFVAEIIHQGQSNST
jgi:hypothetical protein